MRMTRRAVLALDTYQAVLTGGSGGEVVSAGDLDSSRLYALTAHKEQPYMPPNQDMIPQAKVRFAQDLGSSKGCRENTRICNQKAQSEFDGIGRGSRSSRRATSNANKRCSSRLICNTRAATTSAIAASPWSPLVAVGGQMQVSLYHSESGATVRYSSVT